MKKVSIIMVMMLSFIIIISCNREAQLKKRMMGYVEAHNSHDLDKTMAFYTEDAKFIFESRPSIIGKNLILKVEEWNNAINSKLYMEDLEVRGDTVFIRSVREINRWYQIAGIDTLKYAPGTYAVFVGAKIKELKPSKLSNESGQRAAQIFSSLMQWAQAERPDTLRYLMPNRIFDYEAGKADSWMRLLEDWKKATEK